MSQAYEPARATVASADGNVFGVLSGWSAWEPKCCGADGRQSFTQISLFQLSLAGSRQAPGEGPQMRRKEKLRRKEKCTVVKNTQVFIGLSRVLEKQLAGPALRGSTIYSLVLPLNDCA